jgi:hypothetical protein
MLDGAEAFFDPKRDLKDTSKEMVSSKKGVWSDCGNFWAYSV